LAVTGGSSARQATGRRVRHVKGQNQRCHA
jgi:hypothetical protein